MIEAVNVSQRVAGVQAPEVEQSKQQVSMRGSDYERTPDSDTFESGKKKSSKVGLISSLIAAAAIVVGGICLHKGAKVLEGKDASFKEKLTEGWKELIGKFKKSAKGAAKETEEAAKETEGAANEAKSSAAKEAEEAAKEVE